MGTIKKESSRVIALMLMVCMILCDLPMSIFAEESSDTNAVILNPGFESTVSSGGKLSPVSWSSGSNAEVVSGGMNGSNCLKITNSTQSCTFVQQTISLEPDTEYVLTGYIKGENISEDQYTDGAFIGLEETGAYTYDQYNNWKTGTFGWTKVTVYFRSSGRGQATIRCALGHYWGGNSGTAYFDDIEIKKASYPGYPATEKVKSARENITVYMDKTVVNQTTTEKYNKWVDDLQRAYECYAELTGGTPFYGDNLGIINTAQPVINRYGGVGNFNPVLLPKDYARNIKDYNDTGNYQFGVYHEMGHSFDLIGYSGAMWVFDGELMANFKMAYVLEQIQGVMYMGYNWGPDVRYEGADIINYYKQSYDDKLKPLTEFTGDGLTYLLLKVKDKITWEPFKKAFSDIRNGNYSPDTNLNRFDLFLSKLQEYYNPDGTEVYDVFTEEELEFVREHYRSSADTSVETKKSAAEAEIQNLYNSYINDGYEVNVDIAKILRKIKYAINSNDVTKQLTNGKTLINNSVIGIKYRSMIDNAAEFQSYVSNGQLSGTQYVGTIIDGLSIDTMPEGNVQFRAYLKGKGFTEWKNGGESIISRSNEIETLQIRLTGSLAAQYDVYYRTHNRHYSWLGWTKNGELSGSYDTGSAIEGYEVRLIKKGTVVEGVTDDETEAFKTDDEDFPELVTTIYYNGYSNPYIHYKVGDGSWTDVPGVVMEESTDVEGYPYKAVINLGDSASATVCFNDGNGTWDNNNRKNYTFGAGYYTYSNGTITKISKPEQDFKIDFISSSAGNVFVESTNTVFRAETSNNTGEVEYRFSYYNMTTGQSGMLRDYMEYNELSWMFGTPGKYILTVDAKDDNTTVSKTFSFEVTEYQELKITSVSSSLGDRFELGQTTTFSINTEGGRGINVYSLSVNGVDILKDSSNNAVRWTPTRAGTYTIVGYARQVQGSYISFTKTIMVEVQTGNLTTIYYRGFDNPYIHYSVDGEWTDVPGVKMEACTDVEGYAYKAVIDLGDNTSTEVCFNDGNGNWDSDYGNNYTFGVGYYTYSNGKIKKILPPEGSGNVITVYYKGYENPYIHYGINGVWTKVPGVRMEACTDMAGYSYKAEISLGIFTSASVCFTDGNGNWDNNNRKNYTFEAGVYTFSNGTISRIG